MRTLFHVTFAILGLVVAAVPIAGLAQDATPTTSEATPTYIDLVIRDAAGNDVGAVVVTETADGQVRLIGGISGLTPGEHGLHIHETGLCDPSGQSAFASAGAHYNPTGTTHGDHAGDLGNILANDGGQALIDLTTGQFQLSDLLDTDGSALVIHESTDDLITDPSGNSGGRIACGVIG